MGEIAALPVPETGQLAALPSPDVQAQSGADIASPTRQGFRSGMNSVGAAVNQLAGQVGVNLGLSKFADDRFKAAEEYTAAAEQDGGVKDLADVKDFTDLTHFVGRQVGSMAAYVAPAAGLSLGLRRPVTGTMLGLAPIEAGEQVARLNEDPTAKAQGPGAVLRNAAVTGTAIAGINALGGGTPTMAVKRALGKEVAGSLTKAVTKDAVSNAIIEPAEDYIGQRMHQELNPNKQIDTSRFAEEALVGGVFGGAIGGAGHLAGKVPTVARSAMELRERFKRPTPPADPEIDLPPSSVKTPDEITSWLKENETKINEFMGGVWEKVKTNGGYQNVEEFIKDPEARTAAAEVLKERWNNSRVKPVVEGTAQYVKDFMESRNKKQETKYSFMDTAHPNFEMIMEDVLSDRPVYMKGQNKEAADLLMKHGYGLKDEKAGLWERVVKKSEMRTELDDKILDAVVGRLPEEFRSAATPEQLRELAGMVRTMAEDPDHFNETGVPHSLQKAFGDNFESMMNDVATLLGRDVPATAFKSKKAKDGEFLKEAQNVIRTLARSHYIVDPKMRQVLLDEVAPRLVDYLHSATKGKGDPEFHKDMQQVFGPDVDRAYDALDAIRERRTTSDHAFEAKDVEDEAQNIETEDRAPKTKAEKAVYADPRLNQVFNMTKAGKEKAEAARAELQHEFGKNARVFVEPGEGFFSLRVESAAADVGLDEVAWERVREGKHDGEKTYNASGIENGILTVKTNKPGKVENKINLMRLTEEMMRTSVGEGRNYYLEMFSKGMTALMNSPQFRDVKLKNEDGTWDIPDSTPVVALADGTKLTYGDIKDASMPQNPTAVKLRRDIREAKTPAARKKATERLSKYYDRQGDARKSVEAMEEDAMLQLHDEGPSGGFVEADFAGQKNQNAKFREEDATGVMREALAGEERIVKSLRDDALRIESEAKSQNLPESMYGPELASIAKEMGPHLRMATYLRRAIENVNREAERMQNAEPEIGELGAAGEQATDPAKIDKMNTLKGQDAPGARTYQEETGLPVAQDAAMGPKMPTKEQVEKAGYIWTANLEKLRKEYPTATEERKAEIRAVAKEAMTPVGTDNLSRVPSESETTAPNRTEREIVDPEDRARAEAARMAEDGMTDATRANLGRSTERRVTNKLSDSALERRREATRKRLSDMTPAEYAAWISKQKPSKFSNMDVGKGPVDPKAQAEVAEYVKRVLGEKVAVEFIEKMKHAGEFANLKGVETIKISADAADPMSVGYHEAVHAFIARLMKADPKAANVLSRAASSAPIVARLNELLKGHPKAIEQLKDPEERIAYMYQFWAAGEKGLLAVGPETKTFFDKVKGFFRKVAAIWADDMVTADAVDRAGDLLAAFHNGAFANPSTVKQVLHDRFPASAYEKTQKMLPWLDNLANKFLWTASGAVRDMSFPALDSVMDRFYTTTGQQSDKVGFLQAKHAAYNRFINRVNDVFKTMPTEEQRKIVWDDLHTGKPAVTPEGKAIREILKDAREYMIKKGVMLIEKDPKTGKLTEHPIGDIENYFPRTPNIDYLNTAAGKQAFLDLMEKYKVPADEAQRTWERYATEAPPGVEDASLGVTFFTPQLAKRQLGFISEAEMAPFMNTDLFGTLSQYLSRATRRAEYTARFGNQGEEIKAAKAEAKRQGMTEAQEKIFDQSVQAMSGTLGANMDPKLKNIYSGLMTYQNIRLLPLQLFASLVDPMGIVVRGGTLGEAFTAFGKGIRDLVKFKGDDAIELANLVGSINAADSAGLMSELYGSEYMPKVQRNINDVFFRYNGMEKWNTRMRAQATVAAANFIDRHMNRPTKDSERYLAELGLKPGDSLDPTNEKYQQALNKWVDEAIIRPNAAHRPIYMSDPNWMLISHLKQYTYLFQKVIVSRAYHEMEHGNFTPLFALLSYVPAMIAADMLKQALTPGSGDNNARAGWTAMDWIGHGMQRAGIFGPSQLGLDMGEDVKRGGIGIESAAGPTIQQLIKFAQSIGKGTTDNELMKAIPGYPLIKPAN